MKISVELFTTLQRDVTLHGMKNTNQKNEISVNFTKPTVLVVMGVSGSGKSTLAKEIAQKLDIQNIDADDFHSPDNKAHMAHGKPLTDHMRLPWVNSIRQFLLDQVSAGDHCVLAFSGLRRQHRDLLRIAQAQVIYIYLKGTREILHQRIAARSGHFMPATLLDSQLLTLDPPTAEEHIIELDIQHSVAHLTNAALTALKRHSGSH